MKHLVKVILITQIIYICFFCWPNCTVYGRDFEAERTSANDFVEKVYGYCDYYKPNCKLKDVNTGEIKSYYIIKDYVTYEPGAKESPYILEAFNSYPLFLYGDAPTATKRYFDIKKSSSPAGSYSEKNKEYRALGLTKEGCPFPNPWFPSDFCSHGENNNDHEIEPKVPVKFYPEGVNDTGRYWIKNPYGFDEVDKTKKRKLSNKMPGLGGSGNEITVSEATANMIKAWVNTDLFSPNRIVDLNTENLDPNLVNQANTRKYYSDLVINPPKSIKDNLEDYLAVLSPPTDHSWGIAVAFYYLNEQNSRYSMFYLMPLAMLKNDLCAQFEYIPPYTSDKNINPGEEAVVSVNVTSKAKTDLTGVDFELDLATEDGKSLPASDYYLTTSDNKQIVDKKIDVPQSGAYFLIHFKMPQDSDLKIRFNINKDGKEPDEENLSNNTIETKFDVARPPMLVRYDLDYNILSRKVRYPLANYNISAEVFLNKGVWDGDTTGSLNITNKTGDLLRDLSIKNNPEIDKSSTRVVRNPEVHTALYKKDFSRKNPDNTLIDDPQHKKWINLENPLTPITRNGIIEFGGSISKPYKYEYTCNTCLPKCLGHTGYDTESDDFDSNTNTCTARDFIYNGKDKITPREYANKIDLIDKNIRKKKLFWTSEPHEFNVIRLMYNMDENNKLSEPVKVDGQYKRQFTNQNIAVTDWKVSGSLKSYYGKSSKNNGVLATDKAYSGIEFPIKSGYYFNPAGKYTFSITTEAYKPDTDNTKDHTDLVEAFIKAFRYESNLVYKNGSNKAVYLNNEAAHKSGTVYVGKPKVLSVDSLGLNGAKWITSNYKKGHIYTKTYEEIKFQTGTDERTDDHSGIDTNKAETNTDSRWKNILEGYTESGTIKNFKDYKYREYVKDKNEQDKNKKGMYKITETSTVTITVNPGNMKAYTHDMMANGNYYVKAWIAGIPLGGHTNAYKRLGTLEGISELDRINIKVVGSKSDDIRFSNQ